MFIYTIQSCIAYIVDILIGDPRKLPHPVIYIGKMISLLESMIRNVWTEKKYKSAGLLFPVLIAGGSYLAVYSLLDFLKLIHPWLSWGIEVWLISTTIAIKGLKQAALEIYHHLKINDLDKARFSLSMVVGRDTHQLNESEISRGTVETVAENIVDAIISPLFFALIGGAPLAILYRAVNTLDSMVGYKNDRYKDLGWASARLDDLMNFIPARITTFFLILSSIALSLDGKQAFLMMKRDARLHPSPNSGFPEATVAGALGIQLGGTNYYQGVPSHRAKMGDRKRLINQSDILKAVKLMYVTAFLFILSMFICSYIIKVI